MAVGLSFILAIIALILLVLAALGITVREANLGWLGLALWLLSTLV